MAIRAMAAGVAGAVAIAAAGPAWGACSVHKIADLPVTMSGLRPLVSAKINGADALFVADSGAFYSLISPGVAAEHKLKLKPAPFNMRLMGIGGEAKAQVATVKTFTLAGTPIPNIDFIVGGSEVGEAGLLGQNVLGIGDAEYDLAGGVIRLLKSSGCAGVSFAYWAKDKPVSTIEINAIDAHDPHTMGSVFVNGVKLRAVFDTGAATSMLTVAAAARAGVKVTDAGVMETGSLGGLGRKQVQGWIAPFASFRIGDEEIRSTRLRIGEFRIAETDMLIGADFFLSHHIYVSNSQHRIYLTYNGGPVFNLRRDRIADADSAATPAAAPAAAVVAEDEPKDAAGFSRRGAALAARREPVRAIADFTRAIALDPAQPLYVRQRAMARMANRQPLLAKADLDTVLTLAPGDLDALTMRAVMQLQANDREGARADIDAAAKAAPATADVRLALAGLYERLDAFDPAIGQFDLWIAAHREDSRLASAFNGRCWSRALSGKDLPRALDDCNAAVRLQRTASYLDSRGLVRLRMGDTDKAIADYDAALALERDVAWSLYGRGLARLRKGMKAEGDADIAAALKVQPGIERMAKRYGVTG